MSAIIICDMDKIENIRRCLLWASGRHEKTELGKIMKIPRTRLSSFLSDKATLTEQQLINAEKWLKENAYWIDESQGRGESVDTLLAADLEVLAAILKSGDYPRQEKSRKFSAWVRVTHDGLSDLADAINRGT